MKKGAAFAVADAVGRAALGKGDDGPARGQRLDRNDPEVVDRRMNDRVAAGKQAIGRLR